MADRVVTYRLRAELGQWRAQMAQASASTKKFADDLTGLDKEGAKARRGLDALGSTAGKIGLVAAGGLAAAVVKAANFDQAMSNVQAATHETAQNMDALRQAALDAGAQTVFSATESAAAVENLAKAGVSTADILGGGLQGALDLAAAGSLEVADAAEIAATALTQFGLSGEDVPHVADLLAAGAGKAQGEVSDLSFALKQSGLVAAQMGISVEETVGSLSAFASAGLLGSDAGTSFRTMLLRLANPSKEAKNLMDGLGIAAYDMQGNFVGIPALAAQLQTAFEGQTQATRDAALATIFGSDSIRAANVLYEQGANGIQGWTDRVNDSGYAAETAATRLDNLKGDLEQLGGALETALIGTGSGSQGPLRTLTQNLTDVVDAYNKLPPAAQSATGALLGTGAIVGGSVWAGTKVIRGIADTREALSDLGATSGQTGRALRGLGRAASVAGGLVAGLAIVDIAQGGLKDYAIGVEAVTAAILEMNDAVSPDLPKDLEGLTNSIDRLANPNKAEALQDTISGFLGGIGNEDEYDKAVAQVEAIEAALIGLVEAGNAAAAREWMAGLDLSSAQMTDFLALMPGYKDALAGAANETTLASEATEKLSGSQKNAGKVAQITTERLKAQKEALKQQREAAVSTAESFVNLGDSLDDGKTSLREWIKELEDQADALINFQNNAKAAGEKGLDKGLIRALNEAGEAGALRMRQLANATDEEIDRANKAWRRGENAVDDYVKATTKVPKKKSTWVEVDSSDAMAELRRFQRLMDEATTPRTARLALTLLLDAQGHETYGGIRRAQGGPVYGPGSATSDSIPAWLSNGEFVVKAAAVKHYGSDFLHKLNAMRLANGGMVSRSAPAVTVSAGSSIDYARLANELSRVRPVYGDVTVMPHNYNDFKREMMHDRQRMGLGGF